MHQECGYGRCYKGITLTLKKSCRLACLLHSFFELREPALRGGFAKYERNLQSILEDKSRWKSQFLVPIFYAKI